MIEPHESERTTEVGVEVAGVPLIGRLILPAAPPRALVVALEIESGGNGERCCLELPAALGEERWAIAELSLLTRWEETLDRFSLRFRYDVEQLAERLVIGLAALREKVDASVPVALVAHGTAVAAALLAAAREPESIQAIVSVAGRIDLVRSSLDALRAPSLLVVDAADEPVLELTVHALGRLGASSELHVVPREPALGEGERRAVLVRLAGAWLRRHLGEPVNRRGA